MSDTVRVRINEVAPKLLQVVIAVIGFFAVTMLSDIRSELASMSGALQDVLLRQTQVEQRVAGLENSVDKNVGRLDRMDTDVREFWRDYGASLRTPR